MRSWTSVFAVVVFCLVCVAAAPRASAAGKEIMTDRCSAEVAFGAQPGTAGTIVLKRGPNGDTTWTPPFRVQLSKSKHLRWWCHSTTGNFFDPGTWRIDEVFVGTKCEIFADGTPDRCHTDASIKFGSSAWNGWTPEESKCSDGSTVIRARLGRDRLLQIECLGH